MYLIQFVLFLSLNARLFFYLSGHFMMFGRLPHQPTNQPPLSSMCTYIEQIKYHSHRWCRYYTTKPNQTKPKRKKKYKGLFGFMNCCFFSSSRFNKQQQQKKKQNTHTGFIYKCILSVFTVNKFDFFIYLPSVQPEKKLIKNVYHFEFN